MVTELGEILEEMEGWPVRRRVVADLPEPLRPIIRKFSVSIMVVGL